MFKVSITVGQFVIQPSVKTLIDHLARARHQDREIMSQPSVAPYFMYWFRHYGMRNQCGPTGENERLWGTNADPTDEEFIAHKDMYLAPIHNLIVYHLIDPFDHYLRQPFRKLLSKIFRRNHEDLREDINGNTITALVKVLTCVFATLSLSATVAILYHVQSVKDQIIVMTFSSLIFASAVELLHRPNPSEIFGLNAA